MSGTLPRTSGNTAFLDRIGTEVITVIVGTDTRYTVHKTLICSVSDYFKAAIDGGFRESTTKEVKLSDTTAKVFDLLIHRLYEGKFPPQLLTSTPNGTSPHYKTCEIFSAYYAMVDKLLLPTRFRIEALDSWIEAKLTSGMVLGKHTVTQVLQEVPEQDPSHKLVLDFAAFDYVFVNENTALNVIFSTGSDAQKKDFAESMKTITSNGNPRQGCNLKTLRKVMNMERFTSIADMPRYQIGFLSKDRAGAANQGANGPNQ